jgi:uncharacterized membrane protein YeaQ/YmgE (transglycosylase-associated protein family)
MSYVWVGLIGAVVGLLTGQFLVGSRHGVIIDCFAGAIGAWIAVVLSRIFAPVNGDSMLMSSIVAVIGAMVMLFVMYRFVRSATSTSVRRRF